MHLMLTNCECFREEMNERNKEWVHLGFTEHAESAAEENLYLYLADVCMRVGRRPVTGSTLETSLALMEPHTHL